MNRTVPEDLNIYVRIDGGIEAAASLVHEATGAALTAIPSTPETKDAGLDVSRSRLVSFQGTPFAVLDSLYPQLEQTTPATYVPEIDNWGFTATLGFALDTETLEQVDAVISVAKVLAARVPCLVADSDGDEPLFDSRQG